MKRKTVMLAGAAATAMVAGASLSTSSVANPIPPAASYADLLAPVPDARNRLNSADEAERNRPARLVPVQYGYGYGYGNPYAHHHHHHHHHHHDRRWYDDNGYYWNGYGWAPRPIYHHHHHHHHHHHDWY